MTGDSDHAGGAIRRLLLALVAIGIVGLFAELLLLEHYDKAAQFVPLVSLVAGFIATIALLTSPGRTTARGFAAVMALFVAAGTLGLVLHFRGNALFELEMDASAGGLALFWRAMRGATPALAPGALIQLGLLGLIAVYRHPALQRRGHSNHQGGP